MAAPKGTKQASTGSFLSQFNADMDKIEGIGRSSLPPRYWYGFGNYVLNAVMTGDYAKGVPQGRLVGICGPSGSGKSFIVGNVIKSAQAAGAIVLVVDSENALDDDYMQKIGVDTETDYYYRGISTVSHMIKVVSSFIKGYRAEHGDNPDAPRVLIAIDSLNMLQTDSSAENYEKGVQKGDQGQKAKQIKAALLDFVQDIKTLNISIVVTGHVYKNTDVMNGEGVWIVNDGMKFSLSQILLVTKLKLRDDKTRNYEGVTIKCFGYKTRFTKPFQSASLDVPYDTGIDPYSGLLDVACSLGVVEKHGAWYSMTGDDVKWRSADIGARGKEILDRIAAVKNPMLRVEDYIQGDDTSSVDAEQHDLG